MHPWHEDLKKLNLLQLHWATVQADPSRRTAYKAAKEEAENKKALELIAWFDEHVTTT